MLDFELILLSLHGRPQTFFQGGARTYLKNNKKDTIFPKKVKKHTIFGRPWPARGGARAPPCPPLRTPMFPSFNFKSNEYFSRDKFFFFKRYDSKKFSNFFQGKKRKKGKF
jgi:hypothetical protein